MTGGSEGRPSTDATKANIVVDLQAVQHWYAEEAAVYTADCSTAARLYGPDWRSLETAQDPDATALAGEIKARGEVLKSFRQTVMKGAIVSPPEEPEVDNI